MLVDKPAGPSSFAVVKRLRDRTGARAGHAGTLDPFATGLLLVLLGSATRLAQYLVGLDKRYVTEIDLAARTSTGDLEGEIVEQHEPPVPAELEARLDGLRGEIELPVPAASAVKIDGERAYRLARRGVAVEMPLRRSTVHELRCSSYEGGIATLELRVSSGTYVRAIAGGLGATARRCGAPRSVRSRSTTPTRRRIVPHRRRRLPFLPAVEVSRREPRLPIRAGAQARRRASAGRVRRRARRGERDGAAVNVARSAGELERARRAVAIGTFDGVHLGHRRVIEALVATGLTCRRWSRSTRIRGSSSATASSC